MTKNNKEDMVCYYLSLEETLFASFGSDITTLVQIIEKKEFTKSKEEMKIKDSYKYPLLSYF